MALLASMHQLGGAILEKLLDGDSGHRGPRVPCSQGHTAEFVDYRSKDVVTVLSRIRVNRAYYHCTTCRAGTFPKDSDLDIVSTSFSPGVRRLMARVGGKEAFDEGRQDLESLAGIFVKTKEVERVSETIGEEIEAVAQRERKAVLSGKIVQIAPVPRMYVAVDGTGVPLVPHETEGRPGKDETGRAKTREAKLGCVFTQVGVDSESRPIRDEGSTTYVGAIEAAQEFGDRIFTEAIRRRSRFAKTDGRPGRWRTVDLESRLGTFSGRH